MAGTWTREVIGGKEASIYQPGGAPGRPRFGVLFLHGVGQETLEGRTAFTRIFDELNLACVCPAGARCWWADRPCAEFDPKRTPERHLLDFVMPFFQERWQIAPRSIGLLGISMGGQGALRLAFKHARLFPAVAAISPALDYYEIYGQGTPLDEIYDSKEQCRQDTAIMHVPPYDYPPHLFFAIDPNDTIWYRGNDRLHEKLSALGIPHTADLETEAGGHSWEYFDSMADGAVRFLHAGLEHESRRLL
jgi:pimeloyl-ACP methyl ester carboxylesterase